MSPAVAQPHAHGPFQLGNHLRQDRQVFGGPRHAAPLDYRNEHVQVPQLDAAGDLVRNEQGRK